MDGIPSREELLNGIVFIIGICALGYFTEGYIHVPFGFFPSSEAAFFMLLALLCNGVIGVVGVLP